MAKLRTLRLDSTVPSWIVLCFLQSSSVCTRNSPYSVADGYGCGWRHPASWGNLICWSHHWSEPHNPSILSLEHRQQLLWPYMSHKWYKVYIHCPLEWVSGSQGLRKRCAASSWGSRLPPRHHGKERSATFQKGYRHTRNSSVEKDYSDRNTIRKWVKKYLIPIFKSWKSGVWKRYVLGYMALS